MARTPARTLTAPVNVLDVIGPDHTWNVAWGPHPVSHVHQDEDQGRCYMCNQPITWLVVVKDGAGAHHVLGQDCAARLGRTVAGLVSLARNRAEDRAKAEASRLAALQPLVGLLTERGAELRAFPHPMAHKRGFKGLTLLDYGTWWAANGTAKGSDLARALARLQEALGLETAGQRAAREARELQASSDAKAAQEATETARAYLVVLEDPELPAATRAVLRKALEDLEDRIHRVPREQRTPEARAVLDTVSRYLHQADRVD